MMRWAALDFETATRSRTSACQLGVVIVEDGRELYRQAWLIRPPRNEYDAFNTELHGIGPGHTEHAPEFPAVWAEAMALIGDREFVAHNAPFDIGVIRRCCETYGIPLPTARYHCTVQIAKRTWQLPAYKLPIVAGHVGAQLNHHDALSDASACSHVLRACIEEVGAASLDALVEHHGIRERLVDAP